MGEGVALAVPSCTILTPKDWGEPKLLVGWRRAENMEFEIQKQRGRRRRGAVVVGGNTIETPGCLLYCRGGAVPHIVQDMLADITSLPNAVQLSLPSM